MSRYSTGSSRHAFERERKCSLARFESGFAHEALTGPSSVFGKASFLVVSYELFTIVMPLMFIVVICARYVSFGVGSFER